MELFVLDDSHLAEFKIKMQQAFQKGVEDVLGKVDCQVLPDSDIEESLSAKGSVAYAAYDNGTIAGGAIVIINDDFSGDLHFLFVDICNQNKGIGKFVWNKIEKMHPDVRKWVTHTPYFDKRNLHFYINSCGFKAVEFYSDHHIHDNTSSDIDVERGTDCMFRFEKML